MGACLRFDEVAPAQVTNEVHRCVDAGLFLHVGHVVRIGEVPQVLHEMLTQSHANAVRRVLLVNRVKAGHDGNVRSGHHITDDLFVARGVELRRVGCDEPNEPKKTSQEPF